MANVRGLMVSLPLQNVSIKYKNGAYIGDRVFPILDRVAPKTKIARYQKGAWFRDEAGVRAPGTRANRGGYGMDFVSVNTVEYAFASEVTEEDRRNAKYTGAPPITPDMDAIELTADKIDLKKERLIAEAIKTGTWSGQAGGVDKAGAWAGDNGATFITDVTTQIESIRQATGFKPNVLMLSGNVMSDLKNKSDLLDRIKYTERGIVTSALIASMFDLDEVLTGDAIYSIAKEKKDGTDWTQRNVWEHNYGKGTAFLFYRPRNPGLKIPSAGYQARTAFDNGQVRRTTTWYEAAEHQDVYETAEETDIVITGEDLGYLWYDVLAT